MPETINSVKSWASILDDNARLQAERLSRLPIVPFHVALMPDAHLGIGAAVGCVVPTLDAIIPAAVGVDIGCGMTAVKTSLLAQDLVACGSLDSLLEQLGRSVPAAKRLLNDDEVLSTTQGACSRCPHPATIQFQWAPGHFGGLICDCCLKKVWEATLKSVTEALANQVVSCPPEEKP